MKKEEIKKLPHLAIIKEYDRMFNIQSENGYYITTYKEGDDIRNYNASTNYYFPNQDNYPDYRVIDETYHQKMLNLQMQLFEKETNK